MAATLYADSGRDNAPVLEAIRLRYPDADPSQPLITPLSHNFCDTCNRVRITCTGQLYMCLGQDDHVDLRAPLREDVTEMGLEAALAEALRLKPRRHDFFIDSPALSVQDRLEQSYRPARPMSLTGG